MITVKEYADRRNKSVQAVYKQLRREKNKRRLEGHLIKQNRMTSLLLENKEKTLLLEQKKTRQKKYIN